MKNKPKRFEYLNATKYKLHNKRVIVERREKALGITIQSINQDDNSFPHVFSDIQRGIRLTQFALSYESACALSLAIQKQLELSDITDFIDIKDLK